MTFTMIVGAGFSRAISSHVPLTSDLCGVITREDQDPRQLELIPDLRDGQDLERWLSVLAESQPYLDEAVNAGNSQLFVYAVRAIRQAIQDGQGRAMAEPIPPWLDRLVRFLHNGRHSVVSFNYDTLLESATTTMLRSVEGQRTAVPAFHAQRVREQAPIYLEPQGFSTGRQRVSTYSLLKLHGSLDTFWVPGDVTGETIGRIPPTAWGAELDPRLEDPELKPAGKELFIVPPASAKSAYYANPISRQVWLDAHEALTNAERLCIFGYSLPLTDLTIGNLIASATTASAGGMAIEIVDFNPAPVAANLRRLGVAKDQVKLTRVANFGELEQWVDGIVRDEDLTVYPSG
ncbi:hypothetical protein JQN72_14780 [Phycicoccus sp. CSK15P-2]|uniref:hypothetical protein n=1 Tax=Phycicoccus sp. CSK15P-2 TaxID=2807627 RepID=UPI00194FE4D7|nr:hypothetical protein [Phycicoccus sp. CSK15P-2]MBM6405508.1 hypothetical protein [Phycicoccus sp. CSK15P-2]